MKLIVKEKKPRYVKPASIKELEQLHFDCKRTQYHDTPVRYLVKNTFRDDTANGLTKCIIAWLKIQGYFAARVNTTGIYSKRLNKYIYSGSTKGMADITAVIDGKHVSIEVKVGRDKPRPEQLKVQKRIEDSGGIYIFVHSFDEFLEKIKKEKYEKNI
ncbi:MAG: VRR-NUC domain-containing protein [Bacteroidales bacterium]|jgi:hypothetical protein|nr:VRR-NUC domain-containing protein [Bacteroidales bacterium]